MNMRDQKKQHTRRALADAAVAMFTERGYDDVTMAEVAAQAGVSRRTAFRYFPSKEDLVMQYPNEWFVVFNASIVNNRHLLSGDRIRGASLAIARHIEADPDGVRQLFSLAFAHPTLAGRYASSSLQWVERLHSEISTDNNDDTECKMLAAAIMGVINASCEIWAVTGESLTALINQGLDLMAEHLPTDSTTTEALTQQ